MTFSQKFHDSGGGLSHKMDLHSYELEYYESTVAYIALNAQGMVV